MFEEEGGGPEAGRAEESVRSWWRGVVEDQPRDPEPVHPSLCPEIDCVRHLLPVGVAEAAEACSIHLGVGAERVLITSGHLKEDTYLAALATSLGIEFETFEHTERAACPLAGPRLLDAARAGLLPLSVAGVLVWVIAPRRTTARTLIALLRRDPELSARLRLTSSEHMRSFVARHSAREIARGAVAGLNPELSAGTRRRLSARQIGAGMVVAGAAAWWPTVALNVLGYALGLVFLTWILFRLFGVLARPPQPSPGWRIADDRLPIYTILVPLFQEAPSLPGLIKALRQLDYPAEKLDIKLVIEPNDTVTRSAIERMQLAAPFEIVTAPAAGPRTKPKALNAALLLAHGTFTAIYDAEDRPESNQLRHALDAFLGGDDDLACVQARLTIDNTEDSWLARLFTAEYAGLFDVFLPAIAARRLPIPLGGSSNHFRTDALKKVGGWDPYNVTEDADLGIRFARLGYRTTVIASTTYEEAPARLDAWLTQRTRWFKGWMRPVNLIKSIVTSIGYRRNFFMNEIIATTSQQIRPAQRHVRRQMI